MKSCRTTRCPSRPSSSCSTSIQTSRSTTSWRTRSSCSTSRKSSTRPSLSRFRSQLLAPPPCSSSFWVPLRGPPLRALGPARAIFPRELRSDAACHCAFSACVSFSWGAGRGSRSPGEGRTSSSPRRPSVRRRSPCPGGSGRQHAALRFPRRGLACFCRLLAGSRA